MENKNDSSIANINNNFINTAVQNTFEDYVYIQGNITLTPEQSGQKFGVEMPEDFDELVITLPTPVKGMNYEFVSLWGPPEAYVTLVTNANINFCGIGNLITFCESGTESLTISTNNSYTGDIYTLTCTVDNVWTCVSYITGFVPVTTFVI